MKETLALEVTPDGTPHVWFDTSKPFDSLAQPDGQGGWASILLDPAGEAFRQYGLTAGGQRMTTAFDAETNTVQYRVDGVQRTISDVLTQSSYPEYRLAYPPAPGALLDGPEVAVVIQDNQGMHVAWALPKEGFVQVDLAGTDAPQKQCSVDWDGPGSCPQDVCIEQAKGIEPDAYALARTADGALWLAMVVTQYEQYLTYTEVCEDDFGCYCDRTPTKDLTRGTLQLLRVPLDGTPPALALALQIADIDVSNEPYMIDLRGFGDQLALGVFTKPPGGERAVRLLRIDTGKLAP